MSLNTVNLTGNLVADVSVHDGPNGMPYAKFAVAINDITYDRNSDRWTTYTSYFDCVMFGKRVSRLVDMLVRGRKVSIKGRLRQNRWERDGKKHRRVEIVVDDLELMSATPYDQPLDDDLAAEDFIF